jgi:hypothetical protein
MSSNSEFALTNIQAFKGKPVASVELLRDSIEHAEVNPETIARTFSDYFLIVYHLFHLTAEELSIITAANANLVKAGTKDRGADRFLQIMATHEREVLDGLRRIGNLDIANNRKGLDQLAEMMNNAWEKKQSDPTWKPTDGDPEADRVIWGFVNGANTPQVDENFALVHGMERILTPLFVGTDAEEFTAKKDWLISAMTDVIALRGLQNRGREAKVFSMWSTPRENGLNWISKERLAAFKQALG